MQNLQYWLQGRIQGGGAPRIPLGLDFLQFYPILASDFTQYHVTAPPLENPVHASD